MVKTGASGLLTALSAGSTSQFLRGDGTWATPSSSWTLTRETPIDELNNHTLREVFEDGNLVVNPDFEDGITNWGKDKFNGYC